MLLEFVLLLYATTPGTSQIELTVNASLGNGLVCPEVVEWSCEGTLVGDSILRWFIDDKEVNSHRITLDEKYPVIELNSSFTFVIKNASMENDDLETYYISATLTTDAELLHSMGFSSVQCGTLINRTTYSIRGLDIETPEKPVIQSVDVIYDNRMASVSVMDISLNVSMGYDVFNCNYKMNSYFTTTVSLNGEDVEELTALLNGSDCTLPYCSIHINLLQDAQVENVSMEVSAVNKFNRSSSVIYTHTGLSHLGLSRKYEDCMVKVRCDVDGQFSNETLCILKYMQGTNEVIVEVPVNSFSLLRTREDNSKYELEVRLQSSDETIHLLKTYSIESNSCGGSNGGSSSNVVAIVVPVVLISLLIVAILVIVVVVMCCRDSRPNLSEQEELRKTEVIQEEDLETIRNTRHSSESSKIATRRNVAYSDVVVNNSSLPLEDPIRGGNCSMKS